MRHALLTLTLAAAFTACGGEDPLTTEEYRAELRKICQETDKKREAVEQPTRATPEAIADYLRRLRDINAASIDRVDELEPPDELKSAHDRALNANREGREKVDAVIEELQGGGNPTKVLQDAQRELRGSSRVAQDAARELGVSECEN